MLKIIFFTNIGETRKEGYCGEVKTRHRKDVGGKTVGPGDSGGMPRQRSCQKSQSIKYGVWMECLVEIVWKFHHKKLFIGGGLLGVKKGNMYCNKPSHNAMIRTTTWMKVAYNEKRMADKAISSLLHPLPHSQPSLHNHHPLNFEENPTSIQWKCFWSQTPSSS